MQDLDDPKTTVVQLNAFAKENDIKLPSGLKKAEKVEYIKAKLRQNAKTGYRKELVNLISVWMDEDCNWKDHLQLHGWCTVPIDGWKDSFVDQFFDWLELCSNDFKRDDPDTWIAQNMIPLLHGIIKQGMAHTELQWKIRELCYPIFQELLQTDDLLCSFDGGCFLTAKKKKGEALEYNVKDLWIHNDTPRCERTSIVSQFTGFALDVPAEMECYQGIVNFVENGEKDGGLVLVSNGRSLFHDYMEDYPSTGFKWERSSTVSKYFDHSQYIKICAHAGDLILWDGRMFHCNVAPEGDKEKYRMCLYVSMQPKIFATKKELEKRRKLYKEGRMTGHWTYGRFFEANPKNPRTYGKVVVSPPPNQITELNELRSSLVG
jgi:hypothetical protein